MRNGRAVDLDERFVAAGRLGVNHARNHFLAGSALAAYQHGGVGIGHLLDRIFYIFHFRTGAEQHVKISLPPHLVAQLSHLGAQSLPIDELVNALIEVARFEGFGDVVVGSQFGGAKNEFRGALPRDHDDGDFRLDLFDPLQGIDTVHTRH